MIDREGEGEGCGSVVVREWCLRLVLVDTRMRYERMCVIGSVRSGHIQKGCVIIITCLYHSAVIEIPSSKVTYHGHGQSINKNARNDTVTKRR